MTAARITFAIGQITQWEHHFGPLPVMVPLRMRRSEALYLAVFRADRSGLAVMPIRIIQLKNITTDILRSNYVVFIKGQNAS